MKNIRYLMVARKGHGTMTNYAAQEQNIRHNHHYYSFKAKATVRQNKEATAYFLSPLSLSLPVPLSLLKSTLPVWPVT